MVRRPPHEEAHSARLAGVARFAVRHKSMVIGSWLGLAVVLALLFPQLETVVKQQSLDPIPRDVASFQTLDRMGKAFGEEGSTTDGGRRDGESGRADPVDAGALCRNGFRVARRLGERATGPGYAR